MPLATRTDLEDIIGVEAVDELLRIAVPSDVASDDDADAARQRRLDKALQAGDNLIARYITLPSPENANDTLRQLACEEAIYFLLKYTQGGASRGDIEAADQRRTDLSHMRKRNQMPGKPEGQASHRPRVVESRGRYTTAIKKRYY